MATNMPTNTPLQQQLDEVLAQASSQLPADLLKDLSSPIEQLIMSDAAKKALKEGAQAPDFTLPDALGSAVTLSHLLAQGPVVITFYRGEWCPYCNLELHAYQQALPQLRALGATLVAISPQTPDHSLSTVEKIELTFAVLSDVATAWHASLDWSSPSMKPCAPPMSGWGRTCPPSTAMTPGRCQWPGPF